MLNGDLFFQAKKELKVGQACYGWKARHHVMPCAPTLVEKWQRLMWISRLSFITYTFILINQCRWRNFWPLCLCPSSFFFVLSIVQVIWSFISFHFPLIILMKGTSHWLQIDVYAKVRVADTSYFRSNNFNLYDKILTQ